MLLSNIRQGFTPTTYFSKLASINQLLTSYPVFRFPSYFPVRTRYPALPRIRRLVAAVVTDLH